MKPLEDLCGPIIIITSRPCLEMFPRLMHLQGATNPSPAYTPQELVFKYVLDQLDTANADFASLIAANDNSLNTKSGYLLSRRSDALAKIGKFI